MNKNAILIFFYLEDFFYKIFKVDHALQNLKLCLITKDFEKIRKQYPEFSSGLGSRYQASNLNPFGCCHLKKK